MVLQKAIRGLSLVTVLGFTYALARLAFVPGATQSRLLFFGLLLGCAYVGVTGLVLDAPGVAVVCAALLLAIGFTQFVLFTYVFPTGLVLLVDGTASFVPRSTGGDAEPSREGTRGG